MKKNAKHGWQSLLAAVLSLAMLAVICVPALAADGTALPEGALQSGDGWYRYQAEKIYHGTGTGGEGVSADMQPGEVLEIPVGTNFVEGQYSLTVRSCGNRESFEILVNGQSVGALGRKGTGFGMDQMTDDKLAQTLTLKAGDVIGLKAPSGEYWGWVDYVQLDVYSNLPQPRTESGDGWVHYHVEHFYTGKLNDSNEAADLQPEEVLEIPVNAFVDFMEGKYTLTVRSCGNRESFEILVNGQSVGTLTREGTGFGMDQMTDDKLTQTLTLKSGDVIGLKAPSGQYWGWVDYVQLDAGVSVGHALSIGNDIVVTYDLTGKTGELGGDITSVTATVGGREIQDITWEGNEIKVPVFAKEMRKTIVVTVHTASGDCKLTPYKVTDYLEQYQAAGGAGAAVDFLNKLYAYGDYAAAYFGGSPNQADPEGWDASRLEELKTPGREIIRDHSSARYVGATLVLEDTISLRFYFTYTGEGTPKTVTLDGNEYQNLKQTSDGYFVEVSNIPLTQLNVTHTVTVDGKTLVQNSSVLDYAYSAIKNNMKESGLCKALTVTYWSALKAVKPAA